MASLRRYTGDSSLTITSVEAEDFPNRRPSIGRIRGLNVKYKGSSGNQSINLVLKEPQGSTRTGTAGAGLREVSVYNTLGEQLPVRIPELVASHPGGGWLVLLRLPEGRQADQWTKDDYLLATDQLVALHDRFWGLEEDLATYKWLSRPLDSDFSIHLLAANSSVDMLSSTPNPTKLTENTELRELLAKILNNIDEINSNLHQSPFTLSHGDYWPGNISISMDGKLTVYDWETTLIGPAIVDLLTFIKTSQWWFDPLPISPDEIITHYRQGLSQAGGYSWNDAEWQLQSDCALMWVFISEWLDLLAAIPDSMLDERLPQILAQWLDPLIEAVDRSLSST